MHLEYGYQVGSGQVELLNYQKQAGVVTVIDNIDKTAIRIF